MVFMWALRFVMTITLRMAMGVLLTVVRSRKDGHATLSVIQASAQRVAETESKLSTKLAMMTTLKMMTAVLLDATLWKMGGHVPQSVD